MKKIIFLIMLLMFFCSCTQNGGKVDRIIENGVEIVINHLEPYKIKGEPATFTLEKEFSIDTEQEDIGKIGLTDVESFDSDSQENIYFLSTKNSEKIIFKFFKNGKFTESFGRKGQGPGEVQFPASVCINAQDEIEITDSHNKFLIFSKDGNAIQEKQIYSGIGVLMGRTKIGNCGEDVPDIKFKNNRLYCIREKESGYKELVVYKMMWK